MNRTTIISAIILTCTLMTIVSCSQLDAADRAQPAESGDSARLAAIFAAPPRQYASAPLWTWNDMLTEEQIRSTMRDLASQKVMQVFVHPRPGLMTPYLSDDWFRLWKTALDEAEKLDMNVWIYDENSYPSGFAGGLVPEAMPESRGKGIQFAETSRPPELNDNILAVYSLNDNAFENVTEKLESGQALPEAKYLVVSIRLANAGGWFGGKYYVDLLKPGVTQKFIEVTMEAYRREIGDQFGKRVPGWFTDEPHLAPAGGLHFSDTLREDFQKRWGYDLLDHLPSLQRQIGDWKRVRHNYYQLLLELFIDRWAKPCYEYCEKYNLEFTGHYWEHGWPGAGHGGDNMAMYAWHQRPAIDTLMNQYSEATGAQFGNVRAVLELASVANQLGRTRTLCEAYGAGGWDLRFEDMKRIGDWLYVLGVNTLDEHLSYVTIRGARKRDHPQSFSYHEPWWPDYHIMADYFTRLSAALSAGQQINKILLIEPTTTTWMYQTDRNHLDNIGNQFQTLLTDMAKAQVEFDIGCENIIETNGSVKGKSLIIGQRAYTTVILPPLTESLNAKTMDLLEAYVKAGGKVLCCGLPPTLVEAQPSDRAKALSKSPSWQRMDKVPLIRTLLAHSKDPFAIEIDRDRQGILFHHRRKLNDGQLLFLANTSIDSPASGSIRSAAKSARQWNLETGKITPYSFAINNQRLRAEFDLPPCGSLLLFLADKPSPPPPAKTWKATFIPALAKPAIKRLAPNVLTLDYVDITARGETKQNTYFYQANQFAFRKNGMDRNPWDSAVQLRDNLITKTFPPDSGFQATYKFEIEGKVPDPLHIVIERTDLYEITCNGKKVAAKKGQWWLDKAFGKINITAAAKTGDNEVTIKAAPMTIYHELEPAYLLGDFTLEPTDSGFVVVPPGPVGFGRPDAHVTQPDGTMWLTAGIGFDTAANDTEPSVVFDLGKKTDLAAIKIWNYNEINLTARGVKDLRITAAAKKEGPFDIEIGDFTLDKAQSGSTGPTAEPKFPQTLPVSAQGVRMVKFEIRSNHNGVKFPTTDPSIDNAFTGLSEVRFLAPAGDDYLAEIADVAVAQFSSELTGNFNRRARFLTDGSGLQSLGWNLQGMPFYAQGVSYTQQFEVTKPTGKYAVKLPDWYGSVARVKVNGKLAGRIYRQPWQCDVTESIKKGKNTIEVTVVGTLKNTLGPHHNNPGLGSAWPGMFRTGPQNGPPPAKQYHTVPYGLFEPFQLLNF